LSASFVKNKSIASIIDETMIDEKTFYKFFSYFRRCCRNFKFLNEIRLGGDGIEVEIDETHLFTRKYHRGNVLASEQIWVFGIIERVSKKVYLEVVTRRNGETLFEIVRRVLMPGTIIFADSWAGYNLIRNHFTMFNINHRMHFVDPNDRSIHTNNIERLWRSVKEDVRGAVNDNYKVHLSEFMFRRNVLNSTFERNLDSFIRIIFN
jgi:transposase-like protein